MKKGLLFLIILIIIAVVVSAGCTSQQNTVSNQFILVNQFNGGDDTDSYQGFAYVDESNKRVKMDLDYIYGNTTSTYSEWVNFVEVNYPDMIEALGIDFPGYAVDSLYYTGSFINADYTAVWTPAGGISYTESVKVTATKTAAPTLEPTATKTPTVTKTSAPVNTASSNVYYVNRETGIVHKADCSHIKDTSNYDIVSDPGDYKKCNWWK